MVFFALGLPVCGQAPRLSLQVDAGSVNLSITGIVHTACAVQGTASLAPTNSWQLLSNLVLAASPCVVEDHSATMPNYATVRAVTAPDSWPQAPPPSGLKVAIFSDPDGGSTDAGCIQATISILSTNSGFVPSTITAATIQAGGLTNYDVVMFPGGGGTGQAAALQQNGCAKVEQFVANGGGCIGTCAGAYLAALGYNTQTAWLNLVDASIIDLDNWDRGTGPAQIHILNATNAIVTGFAEYVTAQYINGPLLGPGSSPALPDYEQVAVYVTDIHDNAPAGIMPGTTCLTSSAYQLGRCVLFSFHPELSPGLEQMLVRGVRWAAGDL